MVTKLLWDNLHQQQGVTNSRDSLLSFRSSTTLVLLLIAPEVNLIKLWILIVELLVQILLEVVIDLKCPLCNPIRVFQSLIWKGSINRKNHLTLRIQCDQVRILNCKSQLPPRNCKTATQWAEWNNHLHSILLNTINLEIALLSNKDHNSTPSDICLNNPRETNRHTTHRTRWLEIHLLSYKRDPWIQIGLHLLLSSHQQQRITVPTTSQTNLLLGECQIRGRLHPKRRLIMMIWTKTLRNRVLVMVTFHQL